MADGAVSTVRVEGDSSGAQADIKGLGGTFGGLFSTIASGAAVGGLMGTAITGALSAIGSAIAAPWTMFKGLVTSVADAGDKFFTLSKQTGQSAQALSTYQYIAGQTGTSLDAISNATFKMSINIAKGGKETAAAFKAIGTSSQELRALAPEEQFSKIMKGLGEIPDAGQRALVGTQIFGRGFREIAQLADEDLASLSDRAKTFGLVMSDEMAAAGDAFNDTIGDMGSILTGFQNVLGSLVLPVVNAFMGTVRDEMVVALKMLRDTFTPLFGSLQTFAGGLEETGQSADFHTKVLKLLITVIAGLIDAFAGLVKAASFVIGVYYDIRTAGNLLLIAFGKIVEGVLWAAQQIAIGMSKISFGDMKKQFQQDAEEIGSRLTKVRSDIKGLGDSAEDLQKKKESLSKTMNGFADTLSAGADELRKNAAAYKGVQTEVDKTRPRISGLGDDLEGLGKDADKSKQKVNEFAQTSSKQIAELLKEWKKQPEAIRANHESINILLDKYMRLRSGVMDRSKLPAELEGLAIGFGKLTPLILGNQAALDKLLSTIPKIAIGYVPSLELIEIEIDKVGEKQFDWGQSMADSAQKAEELLKKTQELRIQGYDELRQSLDSLSRMLPGVFGAFVNGISQVVGALTAAQMANDRFGGSAGVASGMFSQYATTIQKWSSAIQSAGAIAGGAMEVWSAGNNSASKSHAALSGAMGGAKAGAMFGPWGMAVGAAAGAMVGFVRQLSAGRRAVVEFADSFGGFDVLQKKLQALGAEGERLWIKLTQQTKKGDKTAAAAVIEEINAALAAQEEASRQTAEQAETTQEEALATIETATQASQALDTLGEKIRANQGDWEHWSAVVTEMIKRVGAEVNAVSVGKSPGGIKEWKPMLRDAMGTFDTFSKTSVAGLREVRREVDMFSGVHAGGSLRGSFAGEGLARAGGGPGGITIGPGAIVIDRPILKDREAMQELTAEVAKQFRGVLGNYGAWANG